MVSIGSDERQAGSLGECASLCIEMSIGYAKVSLISIQSLCTFSVDKKIVVLVLVLLLLVDNVDMSRRRCRCCPPGVNTAKSTVLLMKLHWSVHAIGMVGKSGHVYWSLTREGETQHSLGRER